MTMETKSTNNSLVYDVGMHTGEDTAHYLRRGYRVVAFEANSDLVERNTDRFKYDIEMGNLAIVHGAIMSDTAGEQSDTVSFYVNEHSVWGTAMPDRAAEYEERSHSDAKVITVPRISFANALNEYGVPYYMKTDIEGADEACLEGLSKVAERPAYVSLETDVKKFANVSRVLNVLGELGYSAFKVVNQKDIERDVNNDVFEYQHGCSGEFGPWLPDQDNWMDQARTMREYRELFVYYKLFSHGGILRDTVLQKPLTQFLSKVTGKTVPSWHDVHARHEDVV